MNRILGLRNRQRVRAVDTRLLRRIARWALEEQFHAADYELGLHLVSAVAMTRVNESFLDHEGSTDVITFDHREAERRAPARRASSAGLRRAGYRRSVPLRARRVRTNSEHSLHGEIFLCLDEAVAQARLFDTDWQSELARYLLHGLLHLHGFDDLTPRARRRMKRQENRLLRLAQRQFPLRRLARPRR
jgi:probable rRNA maturation factor